MIIVFDSDIAVRVGVREAIFLEAIRYWTEKNKANGKHFHDGRWWTYNSLEAWSKLYPFFSKDQVRTILQNLTKQGLILVGNYNSRAMDRTAWYALSDSAVAMFENSHVDVGEIPRQSGENPTSYIQDIPKGHKSSSKELPKDFETFWTAYPKKVNKLDAVKAWKTVDAPIDVIINALDAQKKTPQWTKDDGQFIPYPATWLRGRRWENEVETTEQKKPVSLVDLAIKKRGKKQ